MSESELKEQMLYNLDDDIELSNALLKTNFVYEDTSWFTRKEWNTYCRKLKIECEKDIYDYLLSKQDEILELASTIHGNQKSYLITHIEIIKKKLDNIVLKNSKFITIEEKIEIDKENQLIGAGGFSTVYKVKDELLSDVYYAYKVLDPSPFNSSSEEIDMQRFIREANFMFEFNHDNIVKIFSLGKIVPNGLYIKMEYVDGWKLKDYISEKGPLSDDEKYKLSIQLIQAIGYLHSKKILHRDLAERNIMINKNGILKVLDFGLAKIPGKNTDLTTISTIINTDYIAPEVKEDYTKHSVQSDIYSIGCIMFRIYTNRTININYKEILQNENIPNNVKKIIIKCLNISLEERYKNCGEILCDLEEKNKPVQSNKSYSLDKFKLLINEGISEINVYEDFENNIEIYRDMMNIKINDVINSNKFVSFITAYDLVSKCIPHYNIRHYKSVTITIKELIDLRDFYLSLDAIDKENFCNNIKNIITPKIIIDQLPF